MASRMAARSTTAGTPVKSCMSTRAGVKAISLSGSRGGVPAGDRGSTSSAVTATPSSKRSRFSSSTFIEYGRRPTSKSDRADRRYTSSWRPPETSGERAPKEFPGMRPTLVLQAPGSERRRAARRGLMTWGWAAERMRGVTGE